MHHPIRQRRHHATELADEIGPDEKAIAPSCALLRHDLLLPRNHQARKIKFVLMRRGIRAMVVTEFAVVTLVGNPLELRRRQFGDIAVVPVDAVEKRVERRAQVEAASTAVTDAIDPQRLRVELRLAPIRIEKIDALHGFR